MVDRDYGTGGHGVGRRRNPGGIDSQPHGSSQGNDYVSGGGAGGGKNAGTGGGGLLSKQLFDQARTGYLNTPTGYDPYTVAQGPEFQSMNYDPYRKAAINQGQSGAFNQMSQQAAALSQLPGGASASDRMRMFGDFNRQKIMGQLGANAQYDAMGSQNVQKTGMQNTGRQNSMQEMNIGAANDASKFNNVAQYQKAQNLYGAAMSERDLARQLEASGIIGANQMRGAPPGILDDPMEWLRRRF